MIVRSHYPLKSVLKIDEVYTITNCSMSTTMISIDMRFASNIMKIDVKPSSGRETIATYFVPKVTNLLLKLCNTNRKYCDVVVPGVKFLYSGAATSEVGDTYSYVQFLNIQRLEDETMNLQQHLDGICIDGPTIRENKKVISSTLPAME